MSGDVNHGAGEVTRTLAISRSVDDGTSIVVVVGEIDMANAPIFERRLSEAVEDTETCSIVVDLNQVTFMDTTALNALVHCFERQRSRLQGFAVVADDSRVTTLLEVTRLDRLLKVFPTRHEALASVASG